MPRPLSVTVTIAVGLHLDLDEGGVPLQRLVHGIVDHLGEQVMQRLLVGAADIHAGTPAHRLEAFEHLDMAGGVAGLGAPRAGLAARVALPERRRGAASGKSENRSRVLLVFWAAELAALAIFAMGSDASGSRGRTNQSSDYATAVAGS